MRSPKDWEAMSQKKDIEEIKIILSDSIKTRDSALKKGIASLIISIISSFTATFLTSWMSDSGKTIPVWGYVTVVGLVITISVVPFTKDIYRRICRKETHTQEERIAQVNLFDNTIIYNIMLANRYFDLYQNKSLSMNEKEFYVTETKYFIRKTIHQLKLIKAFSLCKTVSECGYGKNKKILKERIESSLNFVLYILGRIGDVLFFREIKKEIDSIIVSLGLNKDVVYKHVKVVE